MILPLVLSSHEEATVRCAKARPGSNSSTGSKAPVRLTTSGPHVLAKLSKLDPVFIDRCDARGVMQNSSHLRPSRNVARSRWLPKEESNDLKFYMGFVAGESGS
jgi:hypothetical protein